MNDVPDDQPPIPLPTPGDLPCPRCGYLNTPHSERCGVCGAELTPPDSRRDESDE